MATRKGKGRQAVRNNGGGFPAWAGILVGILIGALVVVVLMRHSLVPMTTKGPQPNPDATAQPGSDEGMTPAAGTTSAEEAAVRLLLGAIGEGSTHSGFGNQRAGQG